MDSLRSLVTKDEGRAFKARIVRLWRARVIATYSTRRFSALWYAPSSGDTTDKRGSSEISNGNLRPDRLKTNDALTIEPYNWMGQSNLLLMTGNAADRWAASEAAALRYREKTVGLRRCVQNSIANAFAATGSYHTTIPPRFRSRNSKNTSRHREMGRRRETIRSTQTNRHRWTS